MGLRDARASKNLYITQLPLSAFRGRLTAPLQLFAFHRSENVLEAGSARELEGPSIKSDKQYI